MELVMVLEREKKRVHKINPCEKKRRDLTNKIYQTFQNSINSP